MATVNFSVPDDVRDAFNETFKDRNKSAIVAELMRETVDRFTAAGAKSPGDRANPGTAARQAGFGRFRHRNRPPLRTSMIAVLDASVVVKWFLGDAQDEPHAARRTSQ